MNPLNEVSVSAFYAGNEFPEYLYEPSANNFENRRACSNLNVSLFVGVGISRHHPRQLFAH